MPSLKDLGEFSSLFRKVGKENELRLKQDLPLDELHLPETEPEELSAELAAELSGKSQGSSKDSNGSKDSSYMPSFEELDDLPLSDLPLDDFPMEEAADDNLDSSEDFLNFGDLGDLLGGSTQDITEPDDDLMHAESIDSEDTEELSDFLETIPDDFSDSISAADTSIDADEPSIDEPSSDGTDLDASFDMGGELGDTELGGDIGGETFEEDSFSEDTVSTDAASDDSLSDGAFDLGDIGDLGDFEDISPADTMPLDSMPEDDTSFDDMPFDEPSADSMSTDASSDDSLSDGAFDLGDIGDLGDFEDISPADTMPLDSMPEDDTSFGDMPFDEPSADSTDLDESFDMGGEFGDAELGGEAFEEDISDAGISASDMSLDESSFDNTSFGADDLLASESEELDDMSGFEMGGELLGEASLVEEPEDSFDHFDLGGDSSEDQTDNLDALEKPSAGSDDFGFPDIDDFFSKTSKAGSSSASHDPEEINLTEDEVNKLNETLAYYPLNLRIACKEIIVEEAVAPELMVSLIKCLTTGAPPKETAAIAGKILQRTITIPKGFELKTGQQLEEEHSSFLYIFIHNFLPVLRTFMLITIALASLGYLVWTFIYKPLRANAIYQRGYERIAAGEYARSRELFREAFDIHPNKEWFFRYAQRYRDERQYILAQEKYDELLHFTALRNRRGIPDKKAVLEYAEMETYYLRNYAKADWLLRRYILDFSIWDREALLALGDNNLAWGEIEYERYEDAREAYAKLIERYGRTDPLLERMLLYFIRTDNLREVLNLQNYFMASDRRQITADTLAEMGGYLLDKLTEEVHGVRDEFIGNIRGIREVLLRAVRSDPLLPEAYYHLARYYNSFSSFRDEELVLARAIQAFEMARMESPQRLSYRLESLRRFGEIHVHRGEFFRGEEYLINAARLYEDGLARRIITPSPAYGRIFADLGDLEFFAKEGNAVAALNYYRRAEQNGFAPPEIQYRMGAAHYQLSQWPQALERFAAASFPQDFNQRILYALGNTSYMRGNYYAAQGYFTRLLETLEADMTRFVLIRASDNLEENILTERLMVVQNNLAVTLEALANREGNNEYRARAMSLYTESQRAWDVLTRNPETLVRMRPSPDLNAPGVNPAFLNIQNSLYPVPDYEPLFFIRIDKDLLEPSIWDEIAPANFRLAEGIYAGR